MSSTNPRRGGSALSDLIKSWFPKLSARTQKTLLKELEFIKGWIPPAPNESQLSNLLNLSKATNKVQSSSRLPLHPEHRCVAKHRTFPALCRRKMCWWDRSLGRPRRGSCSSASPNYWELPACGDDIPHNWQETSTCQLEDLNFSNPIFQTFHHVFPPLKLIVGVVSVVISPEKEPNRRRVSGNNYDRHALCLLRGRLLEKYQNNTRSLWFMNIKHCSAQGASWIIPNTIPG